MSYTLKINELVYSEIKQYHTKDTIMKLRMLTLMLTVSITFLSSNGNAEKPNVHMNHSGLSFADVTVANKTSDSTAQLTITNSQIQSGIISVLTHLPNATITSDAAAILVGKQITYLLFKVNSPTEGSLTIAIELSLVGNVYKFQNIPGKQFHRCSSITGCPCNFIINSNKGIIGCGCNQDVLKSESCKHRFFSTY